MTVPSNRPPCSLCHFCRTALEVRGIERGGYCLWFDAPIREDEIDDRSAPLRRTCLQDGDHFIWRMKDTDPIALVAWRKSLFDQEIQRRHRAWTLAISISALVISLLIAGSHIGLY